MMDPQSPSEENEKIDRLRRAMYSRSLSDKLKDRPRREMDEIRPIVGEDWQRREPQMAGSTVAPRTISVARKALWWVLWGSAIFFTVALAFFAYYFTLGGGSSPASAGNIDIAISGPPQIAGGEPSQLQITVTNRNSVALELADLVVNYPAGTRSPSNPAADLSNQRITLGTIEAGGRRQGTVSAIFAGGSGTDANVKIDLEYRLAGSNAVFVASTNYQANFSSAPISISVDAKQETVSGQTVEFVVTLASNANTPVNDVLLAASYPFGFSFTTGDPKPSANGLWELGALAPGQKKQVTIRGILKGESGDERVFRFTAGTRPLLSDTKIGTTLAENTHAVKVTSPFLGLTVAVNKQSGSGAAVAPGENVNVVVTWQNNLPTVVTDAVIVARLSGLQIDGSTVHTNDGFYRSTDNVVLWDKSTTNGVLGNVAAGAKGTVSFSFQMPSNEALKNQVNPSLTISINAAGKRLSESGVPENLQSTASQRVAIASDLQIIAQGLYYANPFGSSGPMPPKAGTETTYAVVFTLTNTTNKITNAKLKGTLPPYVRWIGICSPREECETPGPNITFNSIDSTVTWDIGTLDIGVGLGELPARQSAIAIGLTPSTSQIGQEPALLQNIVLTGTDAATGKPVSKTLDNVTTDLIKVSKTSNGTPTPPDPGFSSTNATVVR